VALRWPWIWQYSTTLLANHKINRRIYTFCQTVKMAIDLVINTQQVDRHMHVPCAGSRQEPPSHTLWHERGCYTCMDPWTLQHILDFCFWTVIYTVLCELRLIYYNDLADVSAKNSINDAYDIPTTSELTTDTCKRLISKQCNPAWQTRWDRSSVARTTYELAPTVGQRLGYCSLCGQLCKITPKRLYT